MIVGFSKHGKGSGQGAVDYLTAERNLDGTERTPPPVVLRGHPVLARKLIDALPFEWTHTSGVLSFAPGECITPEMEQRIMDGFERAAFAGLDPDRYSILWVRHQHAGHHELHFVTPRVDLLSGKSLNIAPPGKATRELFDTFRSQVNAEYGLADPDDQARAQDVSLPNHLARLKANAHRQGEGLKADMREVITAAVRREVDAGRIHDRAGVVSFLEAQGFTIPRQGKGYLTVLDARTGEKVRLKGGLYRVKDWNPRESAPQRRKDAPNPARAAELAEKLTQLATARAAYHRQRYGEPEQGAVALPALDPSAGPYAASTRRRLRRQRMALAVEAIERGMEYQ